MTIPSSRCVLPAVDAVNELQYTGAMPLNALTMLQVVQQGLQAVFDKLQDPATAMREVVMRVNGALQG